MRAYSSRAGSFDIDQASIRRQVPQCHDTTTSHTVATDGQTPDGSNPPKIARHKIRTTINGKQSSAKASFFDAFLETLPLPLAELAEPESLLPLQRRLLLV